MSLILFYNALTNGAAIAQVTDKKLLTTKVFANGSFGQWTHIVRIKSNPSEITAKLFLYNKRTREGAVGLLEESAFTLTESFLPGSFGIWTHIVSVGSLLFFYDRDTGAAAIATAEPGQLHLSNPGKLTLPETSAIAVKPLLPNVGTVSPNQNATNVQSPDLATLTTFSPGSLGTWSHVTASGTHLLFYDKEQGAGRVYQLVAKEPATVAEMAIGAAAAMNLVMDIPAGSMGTWTHVVGAAPYWLFYNRDARSGRIAKLGATGLGTLRDFDKNSFGHWTHLIIGPTISKSTSKPLHVLPPHGPFTSLTGYQLRTDGAVILFYDATTGAGALGQLANDAFHTTQTFSQGSFGWWTSISNTAAHTDRLASNYTMQRTKGGVFIMAADGSYTEVKAGDEKLSSGQRRRLLDTVWQSMHSFFEDNADEIVDGKITATDLGGIFYGTTAAALLAILAPFSGNKLLDRILKITFVVGSQQTGRYYGAAADELVNVLKGESKPTLTAFITTLATLHIFATRLPVITAFGTDAWALTKTIGAEMGQAVDEVLQSIGDVVSDAVGAGQEAVDDALEFIGSIMGI